MLSILKSISNDNHHNNCNELTDAPYHHYQNDNHIYIIIVKIKYPVIIIITTNYLQKNQC